MVQVPVGGDLRPGDKICKWSLSLKRLRTAGLWLYYSIMCLQILSYFVPTKPVVPKLFEWQLPC